MEVHEASFEVRSKTDAIAVERLLERLYDTLREELRTVRDDDDPSATLQEFAALRDAARGRSTGRLTVTYDVNDGEDEDPEREA